VRVAALAGRGARRRAGGAQHQAGLRAGAGAIKHQACGSLWEEALRGEVVDALWQDGEQEADAGRIDAALQRFEQAVDAAVKPCADSQELRDHIVAMRRRVTKATDGGEDKREQVKAKNALAKDLASHGGYAEALALYQEALA
jgi:hypothetical protein